MMLRFNIPLTPITTAWWDNLVAEELQARFPAIMFASRGALTTNSTDDCGKIKVELKHI
jgi:Domain of unknown function (DUF5010)